MKTSYLNSTNNTTFSSKPSRTIYLLLMVLFVFVMPLVSFGQTSVTLNSSGNFTVPAGVYSLNLQIWGAGGAGAGSENTTNLNGGGGGGAGGYVTATLAVTPGQIIAYTVGVGGTGGVLGGGGGGFSRFTASFYANGADGGSSNSGPNPSAGGIGSGGSAGAITGGSGTNGTTTTAGNGGNSPSGGTGGIGRVNLAGLPGAVPGGGGGGARRSTTGGATQLGGNGGNGQIIVIYTVSIPITCTPSYNSAVEPITNVTFAGINKTSAAAIGGSSLETFTDTGTVIPGYSYPITIQGNTDGDFINNFKVYIDWDQDGSYSTSEMTDLGTIKNSTGIDGIVTPATNVLVPAGAVLGTTKMRVVKVYSNNSVNPCFNGAFYGQAEDYSINVVAVPTISAISPSSGCIGSTITITGTNLSGATAANVKIGGTAVLSITSNNGSTIVAVVGTGTTGTVTVTINGNTATSAATYTVYNTAAPTGLSVQTFCASSAPKVSNLSATGAGIKWYAAASGGINLASTTLLTTGSYYATQTLNGCESVTRLAVTAYVAANVTITPNKVDQSCTGTNNGSISPILSGGMTNVKKIRLTQKFVDPDAFQQVAEIEAYEIFTGTNKALSSNGATVAVSSTYAPDTAASKAIDGINTGVAGTNPDFWHSAYPNVGEYIEVTLSTTVNIDYLKIYNRSDGAGVRGQNMLLELLDGSGIVLYAKTVDLRGPTGTENFVNVNVLDVSWSDAATPTLNRTALSPNTYTLNYADANTCSTSSPISVGTTNTSSTAPTAITGITTICSGGSTNLSISGGSAGTGATAKWYTGSCGGTLVYTGNTFTVSPSTSTIYYVRYEGGTCNVTTACASQLVTVRSVFTTGTIANTGQTICYGGTPSIIGSTTDSSGGDGNVVYSWRSSADSYVVAISGATSATYLPPAGLTVNTSYRRYARDGACNLTPAVSSNTWTVTVRPQFNTGTIAGGAQIICSGGIPNAIGSTTVATGGNGTITYSWRSSADNYVGVISGATSSTYTPPSGLTATTSYRRYAKDATCNTTPTVSNNTWTVSFTSVPAFPVVGAVTQPTCATSTGSVALSGLPAGDWVLTRSPGGAVTTGTGTSTFINGLPSGTFTYSVATANIANGLKGEYFNNMTLSGLPTLTRTDATINGTWGAGSPDPSINNDNFSVRWTGQVQPLYSETYTFSTFSDDGIRLWVNGSKIIDNWSDHGGTTDNGNITLTTGVKYTIILEFYENAGEAVSQLSWISPSQASQIIPQSQLYPAASCSSTSSGNVFVNSQPITPLAPTISTMTPPNCITPTGSVVLSDLPTGSWTINATPATGGLTGTTGSTGSTTIGGLTPGQTYTFTVTNSSCTSPSTGNAVINTIKTSTYSGSSWSPTPDLNTSGTINSSTPLTANVDLCSCTVSTGVNAVVNAVTLKLQDKLVINGSGTLTFNNGASLVQINDNAANSGNIIYKRTSSLVRNTDYTYWSSPVAGQTLSISPSYASGYFYTYNDFANPENWEDAYAGTVMVAGKGYISRGAEFATPPSPSTYAATFSGAPNNGVTTVAIGASGRNTLLGNPYPSAININTFYAANNTRIDGTFYFWTHNTARALASSIANPGTGVFAYTSDDYATYNGTGGAAVSGGAIPTGMVASGQAFFTTTTATGQSVTFNNSMRVVGTSGSTGVNQQFFKIKNPVSKTTDDVERNRVWLNMTNTEGAFKQLLIGYVEGATNDYEARFDGESFDGNDFIDFYSINNDKNLTIQGRALPFDENDEVPLGFRSTIEGPFTINIDQVDGSMTNQEVFLEDKLTNSTTNLKTGNYTFNTVAGTFYNRFVLKYKPSDKTLGNADFDAKSNRVLVSVKNKQIKVNSFSETIAKVTIYDLLGRQIFQKDKVNSNEFLTTDFSASQTGLIVKTTLQNGTTITNKIIF